jgi:hypothetical protein
VKIGHISGRITIQFDSNCTDQTKVYGWVERLVGRRTTVDARGGGLNFYPMVYAKERILKLGHFVVYRRDFMQHVLNMH